MGQHARVSYRHAPLPDVPARPLCVSAAPAGAHSRDDGAGCANLADTKPLYCPIIDGLIMVWLTAEDEDHTAIYAAVDEMIACAPRSRRQAARKGSLVMRKQSTKLRPLTFADLVLVGAIRRVVCAYEDQCTCRSELLAERDVAHVG